MGSHLEKESMGVLRAWKVVVRGQYIDVRFLIDFRGRCLVRGC